MCVYGSDLPGGRSIEKLNSMEAYIVVRADMRNAWLRRSVHGGYRLQFGRNPENPAAHDADGGSWRRLYDGDGRADKRTGRNGNEF